MQLRWMPDWPDQIDPMMRAFRHVAGALTALFLMGTAAHATCQRGEYIIRMGVFEALPDAPAQNTANQAGNDAATSGAAPVQAKPLRNDSRALAKALESALQRNLNRTVCLKVTADASFDNVDAKLAALENNTIHLATIPMSALKAPIDALTLPFAFRDPFSFQKFMRSDVAKNLADLAKPRSGGSVIAIVPLGFEQFASKKPMIEASDATGVRFRRKPDEDRTFYSILRGTSREVAQKNLTIALKDGTVQAVSERWGNVQTIASDHEFAAMLETNHRLAGLALVMSDDALKPFGSIRRGRITKALQDAAVAFGLESLKFDQAARDILLVGKTPVFTLTDTQWNEWRAATASLWSATRANPNAKPLLDAINASNR